MSTEVPPIISIETLRALGVQKNPDGIEAIVKMPQSTLAVLAGHPLSESLLKGNPNSLNPDPLPPTV